MARGSPLSNDLRLVILTMACKQKAPEISELTGVPISTVRKLIQKYRENGTIYHRKPEIERRGRPRKINLTYSNFLTGCIDFQPDRYLDELRQELQYRFGMDVDESTIWRALQRRGFTMKKITRQALEACEVARMHYRLYFGRECHPDCSVFVDESSFDRRTTIRRQGWALSGKRAVRKVFFVRGRRYSLLPALTTQGIIHAHVVEGSFTHALFQSFTEDLLDKMDMCMPAGSTIILDNARIHKSPQTIELIRARGYRIKFLPPYSPDFNPIELAFSVIKSIVQREQLLGRDDDQDEVFVSNYLCDVAYRIGEPEAEGFFYHCGYL